MISSFYENGDPENRVRDYNLTRLTEYAFDLQVWFQKSSSITMSIKEPDQLFIKFKEPLMFMDSIDATQLEVDLSIDIEITPQYSQDEIERLQLISESVGKTVAGISIGIIIL